MLILCPIFLRQLKLVLLNQPQKLLDLIILRLPILSWLHRDTLWHITVLENMMASRNPIQRKTKRFNECNKIPEANVFDPDSSLLRTLRGFIAPLSDMTSIRAIVLSLPCPAPVPAVIITST
jgi:hypothetical protein